MINNISEGIISCTSRPGTAGTALLKHMQQTSAIKLCYLFTYLEHALSATRRLHL